MSSYPKGWPNDTAPPFTLTLSFGKFNNLMLPKAAKLNASFISNRLISSTLRPDLDNA